MRLALVMTVLLLGCGGAQPSTVWPRIASLQGQLGTPMHAYRNSAAFDASSQRWLVRQLDAEPGEAAQTAFFGFASAAGDSETDLPDAEQSLDAFAVTPNLVRASADIALAIGMETPLVRIGEDELLYVEMETSGRARLYMAVPSTHTVRRLGERHFAPGPFDAAECARDAASDLCERMAPTLSIVAVHRAPRRELACHPWPRGPARPSDVGPLALGRRALSYSAALCGVCGSGVRRAPTESGSAASSESDSFGSVERT